jgi:hypothetical protein
MDRDRPVSVVIGASTESSVVDDNKGIIDVVVINDSERPPLFSNFVGEAAQEQSDSSLLEVTTMMASLAALPLQPSASSLDSVPKK